MLAFPALGMEATDEFEVRDMPTAVAVGRRGNSVHIDGPKVWARSAGERIEAVAVS